jgi:hypothetical protein
MYDPPLYPLCVYAYCVDTHGIMRTTPLQPSIALDRNKATRTKQGECEEEVGKKNLQLSHPSIQTNYI